MKMLNQDSYKEISFWMHRNARPLELALWNYYHEEGEMEDIIKALAYYQNSDGGFAGQVEPDIWSMESSPYATMIAIGILRRVDFFEVAGLQHPMVQGIFRFLESGIHTDNEGWMFGIPSNDKYPRAPWWTYNEEVNKVQNAGITATLCAFILRYGIVNSELFEKAKKYAILILEKASTLEDFGEMGARGIILLLKDIIARDLSGMFQYDGLEEKLKEIVNRTIERNPEQWAVYTPRPSDFIQTPDSPLYKGNEEIVAAELDYLIDTRKPDGVWDITWSWHDLGDKYAKEFAISENWWKASKAIDKLEFLKNFGRME